MTTTRDCNAGLCAHGPDAVHVAQPCAGCGRAVGMDAVTRDGAGRWVHVGCASRGTSPRHSATQ